MYILYINVVYTVLHTVFCLQLTALSCMATSVSIVVAGQLYTNIIFYYHPLMLCMQEMVNSGNCNQFLKIFGILWVWIH